MGLMIAQCNPVQYLLRPTRSKEEKRDCGWLTNRLISSNSIIKGGKKKRGVTRA
jgi:hypothetical protein